MPQVNSIIPTEHAEAVWLAQYLQLLQRQGRIELFSHVPNETFTTQWSVKLRNKQEGVKQGVPDYLVIVNNHILFIELKRVKGGVISPEQAEWILKLNDKQTKAKVCRGYEQAKQFIEDYL